MKSTPVKAAEWAAGLAARLRLLQASFADDPLEVRERTLRDELEQALKTVALGQRKECIEALAMEFPVPEASKEDGAGKAKVAEATVPETPSVLVDRLIGLTRVMSPAECESIVAQFAAAGLLPASNGATEISEELKERLQKLAPGKRLDQSARSSHPRCPNRIRLEPRSVSMGGLEEYRPQIDHPSRIGQA